MSTAHNKAGISCILVGLTAMSVMDATIKYLAPDFALHQIILVRTLVALLLTLVLVKWEGGLHLLNTARPGLHGLRGLMIAIANMAFYLSIAAMPIAEATGLFFIAPAMITALSGPLLGEKIGWRRWAAIAVGFAGVALISGIGRDVFKPVSLLPLLAALTYALNQIMSRKLGVTEKASVMSFYISVVFLVISVGFGLWLGDGHLSGKVGNTLEFIVRPWVVPDRASLALMAVAGFLVAAAGYFVSQAYRLGRANIIAPYEYVVMPLAVLWGWLFWNEIPGPVTLLGIALIVLSGVYGFIRERARVVQTDESASTA